VAHLERSTNGDGPPPPAAGIVVGVDGSEHSLWALDWAADEAERRRVPLQVLHVNFWTDEALRLPAFAEQDQIDSEELRTAVDRAEKRHPGVNVVGRRCAPPAAEALVDASRTAELVVVGTRGLGLMENLTLGSVSHYVACHAHCPVVLVPAPVQ